MNICTLTVDTLFQKHDARFLRERDRLRKELAEPANKRIRLVHQAYAKTLTSFVLQRHWKIPRIALRYIPQIGRVRRALGAESGRLSRLVVRLSSGPARYVMRLAESVAEAETYDLACRFGITDAVQPSSTERRRRRATGVHALVADD